MILTENYFLLFLLGKQASNLITILLHFFSIFKRQWAAHSKTNFSSQITNEIFDMIFFLHRQRIIFFFGRKKKLVFFGLHSLGVILDQFFVPEFHVSVDCTFEEIVMVIIISKGLNLEQMIEIGSALLFTIHASDV